MAAMGLVMKNTKLTGNKKPLGNFAAEAAQPEGAVLPLILVKLGSLSNLVSSNQLGYLQYCKNINLFHYMLIVYLKNILYIEYIINKYLVLQLPQSAKIAED